MSKNAGSWRPAFKKVGAVCGGLLAAFALGEIAVRILLTPPAYVRLVDAGFKERIAAENAEQFNVTLDRAIEERGVLYLHTPTGFRLRANTHAIIENHFLGGRDVEIRTNSLGYRNREIGPKTRKRVLFLGDSITIQAYLDEADTIVRQVEELSASTPDPVETINAGVSAIGLANELAVLLETGLSTDPDIVVLNWYLNDAQPSRGVTISEPPALFRESRLLHHLHRALSGLTQLPPAEPSIGEETLELWRAELADRFPVRPGNVLQSPEAFNEAILKFVWDWGSAWSDLAWEHTRPLFGEIARRAETDGFRLLIVAFPLNLQILADYEYDYPQRKLKEVSEGLGVPVLDLLPILRSTEWQDREPLLLDSCHPGARGSRIIASAILDFIQDQN